MENGGALALKVDIVSDVVCPWCIIGYKQLQKALAAMPGEFETELTWHPFELNPQMPQEGQNLREHIAQKYGSSTEQSRGARDRLKELGHSLGFEFDYFDDMRMVNTFRAHRLLHWARNEGLQTEMKLALFEAFFSQRKDVNDPQVLLDVCEQVGLDRGEAGAVLSEERYAAQVREEQAHWRDRDVYAVPTFLFQGQYPVPGAQEAETLVRLLRKIRARDQAE